MVEENRVEPEPARAMAIANDPTVLLRAYFSTYHLWAAEHFRDLAKSRETALQGQRTFDMSHRAYATNAVLSSVAYLEAVINELFQDAADGHGSYLQPLPKETHDSLAELWNDIEKGMRSIVSILSKFQLALFCARKPKFEEGQRPYQDVKLLIDLRNALVHYKPTTLGGDTRHRLEAGLQTKFPENSLMRGMGNPYLPDKCLGHGCADWAVRSVRTFADEFCLRLGIVPNYQRVTFPPASVSDKNS
jgi:hypothetical protein